MPKEPELLDIDLYSRDFPNRMVVLDFDVRKNIKKGQSALLIFPTFNNTRHWVIVLGRMDGGVVGELMDDLGEGLKTGDQILFHYRHIFDMRD